MGQHESTLIEQAKRAAAAGEWSRAHRLLAEVDAAGEVEPGDLPLMAEVAYAAGHIDRTIATWERAHSVAMQANDNIAAAGAAVRVAMHLLFDTALMSPVRGWLSRADGLLGGSEPTPVHAWLAVVRSYERMLSGDVEEATRCARTALDVGSQFTDAAAAVAIGRVAHARCLIFSGEIDRGLSELNDAGVAVLSGELDPLSTGVVYCELVCALQGLAQFDLAEEWTLAMERWAESNAIGSVRGRCRVHRAEILRLRGDWREAEQEALRACDELRPYLRRELGWPLSELGRIRLHSGDMQDAEEAFGQAHELGWDARLGLAMVQLERGEVEQATQFIRLALERPSFIPSKELPPNTQLRRAPLLAAAARIETAGGHLDRARAAATELADIAERFRSKALVASAAEAMGGVLLAEGDIAMARVELQTAVSSWVEVGAPYEAACARRTLADALRAERNEPLANLEEQAALATLSRLRAQASQQQGGAPLPEPAPSPGPNTFRLEGEVWHVVFSGKAIRLRDSKGLRHLARLLAEPERLFHALELVAIANRTSLSTADGSTLGDSGAHLDDQAKDAYRRRLVEIEADLDEATTRNDLGRISQVQDEREFLMRELSRAVDLSGRDRRAGAASERARVSVTRALHRALKQIADHHGPLAAHLERTITTGTYCVYRPDPEARIAWET